jgi:hypothetical protein
VKARGEWVAPPHPCLLSPAARFPVGGAFSFIHAASWSRQAIDEAGPDRVGLDLGLVRMTIDHRVDVVGGLG